MLYSISICGKNTCSPLYASYMFILSLLLQVFAIELVTFAVDLVPLAVEFGAFAVEFVGFAVEFVALALQFVTSKKLTTCHEVNDFRHGG